MTVLTLLRGGAGAGVATTDRFEVQRSTDGGVTWTAVRTTDGDDGIIDTGVPVSATVYDYEAPNGTATQYRARALHDYAGVDAASAWATASTTWSSAAWWLKHPNEPALNLALPGGVGEPALKSYAEVRRAARQGVFQAMGASLAIVVSDTRAGAAGTIVLLLRSVASQNALNALLDTLDTLLLQGPVSHGHADRYVRFGDHTSLRLIDNANSLVTTETLPWVETEMPAGAQDGDQYVSPGELEELVIV